MNVHARGVWGFGLLLTLVASACGGKSNGAGSGPAGGAIGASGSPSPAGGSGVAKAGSQSMVAGSQSTGANGGSSTTAAGTASIGGQATGGGGSGSFVAGAPDEGGTGGAPECLDVCAREGRACCFAGSDCVPLLGDCTIDVLAASIGVEKDYDNLATRVAALAPDLLLSLGDADFTSVYVSTPFASRFLIRLSAAASLRSAMLEQAEGHPFRLSCGGQELFLGLVYNEIGAAAIEAPVLHFTRDPDDYVVLHLGAWQGAWLGLVNPTGAEVFVERMDRPEFRAALCRDGVLGELAK